jgi:N-formylglutamate amidohydrolase
MSNGTALRDTPPNGAAGGAPFGESAYALERPVKPAGPLLLASPHSGAEYPADFLAMSKLDRATLRLSEDCYVDELIDGGVRHGVPMLKARFPRVYVDANREALELDPAMFEDRLPDTAITNSPRVAAGLGSIPRLAANDREIYGAKLRFAEAQRRIEGCYRPYHQALAGLIRETRERAGGCLLLDCHSMPSTGHGDRDFGRARVDFVLGDCFGASCADAVTAAVENQLRADGALVKRNNPYSGGYVTQHYGRPAEGVHVLQIEINRAIYMDERSLAKSPGFADTKRRLDGLIALLAREAAGLIRRR